MAPKKYDVAIIGGGIGGLMAAYRLHRNLPEVKLVITERGNTLENRHCPAVKNNTCVHCKHCSITSGYAERARFLTVNLTSAPLMADLWAKNWETIPPINI